MKRILALCLVLVCLTSCAGMLERELTVANPHAENPPPRGEAYRVDTYRALGPALLSYVEEGERSGLLRFPTTYAGNVRVDLEKARRELMEDDPLGNYALSGVDFHISRIIAFYEAELTFTYQVDREELLSLPKVTSQAALVRRLADALAAGESRVCVYLTAYPEEDESYFSAALEEAWATLAERGEDSAADQPPPDPDAPDDGQLPPPEEADDARAQEPPGLRVTLYPQSGPRRVAVLELERGDDHDGPER